MVRVISGGKEFTINGKLKESLDEVKEMVTKKDWDYVAVIAGLPGIGKSTFTDICAKHCCPWYDESYIAFNDDDFIRISNNAKPFSSIKLDESFESLNTKIGMSPVFLRILNHLQIIRQKNLFIFLCLPNFFDLAKGVAIFRAHHLFVCYGPKFGERGSFAAYSRDRKKRLYIDGKKYLDYNVIQPNFRGTFSPQNVLNWKKYEEMKLQHLQEQDKKINIGRNQVRDDLISYVKETLKKPVKEIAAITGLTSRAINYILNNQKEVKQ